MEKSHTYLRKCFNLDGPDGLRYYYYDLQKRQLPSRRPTTGCGGITIWKGVGYYGKSEVQFITKILNSKRYIETIDEQIDTNYRK